MCVCARGRYIRPRLKVAAAWAVGVVLSVRIMDETTAHDSSSVIQMIAECLEEVTERLAETSALQRERCTFVNHKVPAQALEEYRRRGVPMPSTVVLCVRASVKFANCNKPCTAHTSDI